MPLFRPDHTRRVPCYHAFPLPSAAFYIRTDPDGTLPSAEAQRRSCEALASASGHRVVARYEDLGAPGTLLYHKPALKDAIRNIKEEEDWEVLIVADPRCVSDDDSAVHELVHKFSLYGNRLESPGRSWEELLDAMKAYRRSMAGR